MDKKVILDAIKFNFECYVRGFIDEDDFIQAVEEELNLI
jgi:hypothetical protein